MTPDDSARGTVEDEKEIQETIAALHRGLDTGVLRHASHNMVRLLLAHITTLEAQRDEREMVLASTCDLLNSWAREESVEQAENDLGTRRLADRLWSDLSTKLTQARRERDDAQVGHTMVSDTFKDLVPMVTYHSTAQNMLTCVRDALAQARRECDEQARLLALSGEEMARQVDFKYEARREAEAAKEQVRVWKDMGEKEHALAVLFATERDRLAAEVEAVKERVTDLQVERDRLYARGDRLAESAKERAHDAEEKVRMLEHVSMSNPPEDKVDGRAFRLTDDMAQQQRERADRLAEALRRIKLECRGHAEAIATEALAEALRHEVYRNHEHTDACSACAASDALLTPPSPAKES